MGRLFIGALSGTSMDAIDIAVVDLSKQQPRLLACANYPIEEYLAARVKDIQSKPCRILEYAQLDHAFGKLFADCIDNFIKHHGFAIKDIAAIGLHGQTVLHHTQGETPLTLQLGDPNIVAYQTRLTVVADFRRADIAAGGQGAPLAPALHALLFSKANKKQVVVNIGGIANVTVLDGIKVVAGFDAGPGNCLMDSWSMEHNNQRYDEDGKWAASHAPNMELLQTMLTNSFFIAAPPKSTCISYFSLDWLAAYMQEVASSNPISPGVVAATLVELTAVTIASALKAYIDQSGELLVCGGGVNNGYLMERLRVHTQMTVLSTADKGIDPDWVEAMLFAWLASRRLENRNGTISEATGAREATVLGAVYHTLP